MKISRIEVDIVDPFDNRFICGYRSKYNKQACIEGWYRKTAIGLKYFAKYNDDKIGVRQPKIKVKVI